MKNLFVILFIVFSQVTFAGPTAPVLHSHNGRTHLHPLPPQGIAHKHGNTALGVAVDGNNTTVITPKRVPSSTITPPTNNSGLSFVKGDTNCRNGQKDCNVCASNVQLQFSKAAANQLTWRTKPWRFNWPQQYQPNGLRPLDIFNGDPAYALGIPSKHIQGFVRTNSSRYPFAGSHSHKKRGGIFVVEQSRDGKKTLSSLHRTKSRHPSGVHIIGQYLVYGERGQLVFKNIDSPNQQQDIRLNIPKARYGGGLGLLKLSSNNHLIITSGPGGQGKRPRYNRFYKLTSSVNGRPSSIRFISESAVVNPSQWPRGLAFSENLSVITECGTGDIYTVHTSGDEKGASAISGRGYWRLSKLVKQGGKLGLKAINAFLNRQNMFSCSMRAAASVHVNQQNKLQFYCHAYAKDPDGSTFNVLGRSSRGKDSFLFKVGTVR